MFHHYDRRHLVSSDPVRTVARLSELVDRLSWNPAFNCLTRNALDVLMEDISLEGKVAVYWDIDHLGQENARRGKAEVNSSIADAHRARLSDCLAGQVFSGDEFIALPPIEDALPMAERILMRLLMHGMSATFYVTHPHPGEGFQELLQRADEGCAFFKKQDMRGQIHRGYGMEDV